MFDLKQDTAFVEEHRPFVARIVKRVTNQYNIDADADDLMAAGMRGLVEARARFDPSRGVKLKSFAYYRIRGAVIDQVREQGYLPAHVYAKVRASEAADHVGEQELESGQPLTDEQAANRLEDALGKISAAYIISAVGQGEQTVESADSPEQRMDDERIKRSLRTALDHLPERERLVVDGFYFKGTPIEDLGRRMGVSKSWASRIHTRALAQLRHALQNDLAEPQND